MPTLYALLIGIDDYDDRFVNGIRYPKLGGAVRDINHVHAFLRDYLHVPDDNVLKLTAPLSGAGTPEGDWPTYASLVNAFQQLGDMAQAGDQVYIHYAGHGGRAATVFPDLKGEDAFDETIVPVDIGDPAAQYLRDVEIHALLKQLTDKDLAVTVVFDSCHSGGATRKGITAVARGIEDPDVGPRPHVTALPDLAGMTALWRGDVATRGVKANGGLLLDGTGYIFLAACRPSESAYEYAFNGTERNGALTYFLLDTLRQARPGISYRAVMDRIIGNIRGIFAQQTPMLQGNGERSVFATDAVDAVHAVRVLEVQRDGTVRLQAGEVHGIAPGACFNLFRYDADLTDAEASIAVVEVQQVQSAECSGVVVEVADPDALDAGNLAVLVGAANVTLQRPVHVAIDDATQRQALEQAITAQGKGFVVVAGPNAGASQFQVRLNDAGVAYQICDPAGEPRSNVAAIPVIDGDTVKRTVERLVHLAKYCNVEELRAPGGEAATRLRVELVDPPPPIDGQVVFRPDDTIIVRITNMQTPGAMNDPTRILNVTSLNLSSDWSITQVHPYDGADFESLDPGQSIDIELVAYLPDGVPANSDRIKVFATRDATDFRWLELPALDEPIVPPTSRKRSAGDPLAALYDQIAEDRATTRSVRVLSKPKRTWTVGEVDLHVAGSH